MLKAINTNRMIKCGAHCIFYVADWFALLNNKCNGNLDHIRKLGQYFIEIWRASGMKLENVEFIWSNDLIKSSDTYWKRVFDIAQNTTMQRVERCCTAMGRKEGASLSVGQILYPVMQASDVFELKCDICQLGIDQRKVNMLAREYAQKKKIQKPVIVSHHMLLGLLGGKMSKSVKGSAIFMDDTVEDVTEKIMNADCNETEENNPVLEYYKYLVYGAQEVKLNDIEVVVKINDKIYENYQQLLEDYLKQQITPEQLKKELIRIINMLLQPIRDAFSQKPELKELQDFAIQFRTSR